METKQTFENNIDQKPYRYAHTKFVEWKKLPGARLQLQYM